MSATTELPEPAEATEADSRPADHSRTEAIAWAMFVAGYHARIEDSTHEVEFRDRDAFDAHLYEQFRAAYADS